MMQYEQQVGSLTCLGGNTCCPSLSRVGSCCMTGESWLVRGNCPRLRKSWGKSKHVHKNKISYWLIPKVVIKKQETYCSSGNIFSTTLLSTDFIISTKEVMFSVRFVCLSRIAQNRPTQFPWNLVKGCGTDQGRTHYILEWIRIMGQIHKSSFAFTKVAGYDVWPLWRPVLNNATQLKIQ